MWPLQGSLCGELATLTLHTADAFGNVRTQGRLEKVEVMTMHKRKGGAKPVQVRLTANYWRLSPLARPALVMECTPDRVRSRSSSKL